MFLWIFWQKITVNWLIIAQSRCKSQVAMFFFQKKKNDEKSQILQKSSQMDRFDLTKKFIKKCVDKIFCMKNGKISQLKSVRPSPRSLLSSLSIGDTLISVSDKNVQNIGRMWHFSS